MEVFLSWSGPRSKLVAEALRAWLPGVLQSVEPWVSGSDIEAGARWHHTLTGRLSHCHFGVVCLTPENLRSPWLLYEAGALSKAVEDSSVVPYLLGMRKVDVSGPLAHFQSVEADREGTLSLLQAMNAVMTRLGTKPLPDAVLSNALNLWWPQLEASLTSASALEVTTSTEASRTPDQMLQELVESTRGISSVLASLAEKVDAPQLTKATAPKQIAFETEVLDAARATLRALTAEVENEDTNPSMDTAIWRWQAVAEDSTSTLEALNDAIRGAKSLRAYFNR